MFLGSQHFQENIFNTFFKNCKEGFKSWGVGQGDKIVKSKEVN